MCTSNNGSNLSASESEYDDYCEPVGSGMLFEVFQQRGDDESRRYRVYQSYLRNPLNEHVNRYTKKNTAQYGDMSQSSSSSSDEQVVQNVSQAKQKFNALKQSKIYKSVFGNKDDGKEVVLKKKASRKVQYERRKSIKSNLLALNQLKTKESREKNSEIKKRIRAQMNELSKQIDDVE